LFSHLTSLVLQHYLAKEVTQKTTHLCIVCATHSNCCSGLNFHAPNSPKLNILTARFREPYSSVFESLVEKIEEIKQRQAEFWQYTVAAFE